MPDRYSDPRWKTFPVEFSCKMTGIGPRRQRRWLPPTTLHRSDVLEELLLAIDPLLEEAPYTECSWLEEPREYRLSFARAGDAK